MNKIKLFLKKYGYYLLLFACIAMLAAVITLSVVNSNLEQTVNTEKQKVQEAEKENNTPKEPSQPVLPKEPEKVPENKPVEKPIVKLTFCSPVNEYEIGTNYSEEEFVFSETKGQWEIHQGIDFLTKENADVLAVADGEVISVEHDLLNGTVILIKHNDEIISKYVSLKEEPIVKVGDFVKKGEVIGNVAANSYAELSVGSHVHFEVLKNGKLVDPNEYLEISNK